MEAWRPARAATGAAVLAAAFFTPFLSPASAETVPSAETVSSAETLSPAGARARLLDLVNRDRTAAGLASLRLRDDLDAIAGDHSLRMAAADDIFHNDDLFTAATKSLIGAASVGENVAVNTSIDDAHRRLMDSPGHRANILSADFYLLGIGAVSANGTWFVTEVFIKPVSTAVLSPSAAPATTSTSTSTSTVATAPPATASPEAAPPVTSPPPTAPAATAPPTTAPPATATPDTATAGPAGAAATATRRASTSAPRPPSRGLFGALSGGAAGLMLVLAAGAAAAKRRHPRAG